MNESFVVAENFAQCHGRNSAAGSFGGFDGPVRTFGRPVVADGSVRLPRSAALIVSETIGAPGIGSAVSEVTTARERKNARSLARFPKVATASAHSVRASTWGQSSSHA
jgi:hypothetical protein